MAVFLPSLKKSGFLDDVHLTICNVGSRKISDQDDYAAGVWQYFIPNLSIYGFDADVDACDAANAALEAQPVNWTEKHIPVAISDSVGECPLYVTKHPMCSSLYPPNEPYIARFAGLSELVNLDFIVDLDTTTLDLACEMQNIQEIDFLQVDVQGADQKVLQGASKLLEKSILGIQIEVEFSALYKNQPLFRDVDKYVDKYGFSLFDLLLTRQTRAISPIRSNFREGQLLWGDAIYFRDLINEENLSNLKTPQHILKLACLTDALQFPDYALELLQYLTLNYGQDISFNFAAVILESLSQFPELKDKGLENFSIMENLKPYL